MDKTVYIENIASIELGGQVYSPSETVLITSFNTQSIFNPSVDYIEYHVYNGNKILIDTTNDLENYRIYNNEVYIDPQADLDLRVYQPGDYYSVYNFLTPLLSSSLEQTYYISEISSDRTEVRLNSTDILGGDISDSVNTLKELINTSPYYQDFYLNFGSNILIIANNILLDNTNPDNISVLVKLYEPLPETFTLNTRCWAVQKISESRAYSFKVVVEYDTTSELIQIKGPNTSIGTAQQSNKATDLVSADTLLQTTEQTLRSQLSSYLQEPGIHLNIDYSNYSNFTFFSNAETRLENFYYKLATLENYSYSASLYTGSGDYYNSGSSNYWQNKIDEVIVNFDGYEYYLYYESGSTAWPKSNNTPPYVNYSVTSSQATTWLENQLQIAQEYDRENKDALVNTIPEYIRNNSDNLNYLLFVEMAGQHFDDIWLYVKATTEKYNNSNGVDSGISKDLIAQALQDFGIRLYQNNFTTDNLYSTYLGITPSGSLLPYTGQELITNYVTASATGSIVPVDNLSSEIHKRIYHNLPLLVKKKGTVAGLHLLRTIYGIPDTILRINEFGGKDKNTSTWDYSQNEFNYAFSTSGSGLITLPFKPSSTSYGANNPKALAFRFKTAGIPQINTHFSQSLAHQSTGFRIVLEYTGSGYTSGSYSGSIVNPYSEYATLKFISGSQSASIYLPFYNGDWWSVLVNADSGSTTTYTLYAKNKIYNGYDGNTIGFQGASTVTVPNFWTAGMLFFGDSISTYNRFTGSYQEIRYYSEPLSESNFNDYVMNPNSIEQSNNLFFRIPLGGELYTQSSSIHPGVSMTPVTESFSTAPYTASFSGTYTFVPNSETVFYNQPAAGIQNPVSSKITTGNDTFYGNVLSTLTSLQQNIIASASYTRGVNYLEVGYSPQNELNEDIMNSLGYFNIGDYIGDPRYLTTASLSYPQLDTLRDVYFKKYTKSYDYVDYFRLIKFYDNSIFNLIKDFIPARTAAATGAIVKQHLLERNRQRPAQITYSQPEYTASVTSLPRDYETGSIGVFTGGAGGSVDSFINISQSWSSSLDTKAGIVNLTNTSKYEFYNGEYSGSSIECQLSQSSNRTPLLNNVSSSRISIKYEDVDYNTNALNPTNLVLIQSGSASRAPIQDSNYVKNSIWSISRYEGSENTGTYNTSSLIPDTSQISGLPVDYFTNYFAYFDWVGGSDPTYVGGGNVHILNLINAETGTVISLTPENQNIDLVSNIFKQGTKVYSVPVNQDYIQGETFESLVVESGALYKTILAHTSSLDNPNPGSFLAYFSGSNSSPVYVGFFANQSTTTLMDIGSIYKPWLYPLVTGSDPNLGTYQTIEPSSMAFYNNRLGNLSNERIPYTDTLLPLQVGDYIKFGTTAPSVSSSLDTTTTGLGIFAIKKITVAATSSQSSSLEVTPTLNADVLAATTWGYGETVQTMRIYRRVPAENFIVINNLLYGGAGLLIPYNFNPKYNPTEVAKQVGLI